MPKYIQKKGLLIAEQSYADVKEHLKSVIRIYDTNKKTIRQGGKIYD